MKLALILSIAILPIWADSKTEAELRKQLAVAQAALVAEQSRTKALQSGTEKLTDAVRDVAETSKETGAKVEAAADRLIKSQESGKKAVENVAAATQNATKKLADVVTNQQTAVTSAITAQAVFLRAM
mgnify:CR=1 FL=1